MKSAGEPPRCWREACEILLFVGVLVDTSELSAVLLLQCFSFIDQLRVLARSCVILHYYS